MKTSIMLAVIPVLVVTTARPCSAADTRVQILTDSGSPPLAFGAAELCRALEAHGFKAEVAGYATRNDREQTPRLVVVSPGDEADRRIAESEGVSPAKAMPSQGFAVRRGKTPGCWLVLGADAPGAMYGSLDVAETVRLEGTLDAIRETRQAPAIARRGIKFNIPLDARTPSYSDAGDSAQQNIAEGTQAIVELLRSKLPQTQVLLLRIFPRSNVYKNGNAERGSARQRASELVARLAEGMEGTFRPTAGPQLGLRLGPDPECSLATGPWRVRRAAPPLRGRQHRHQ